MSVEESSAEELRVKELKASFAETFGKPSGPFVLASAPGRLELTGNHTDHQGGCVISAALDARVYALVAENGRDEMRLQMRGFGEARICLTEPNWMEPHAGERGKSVSIARGMLASFARHGGEVRGFDAVVISDIISGAGVSSSAAFEMLMGVCAEGLFGRAADEVGEADRVALALTGMEVERAYFGKMSGAQDQIASAVGGVVFMDFAEEVPRVSRLPFDAEACAYVPCLIGSRYDHSLCNDEYDAVPGDMFKVAKMFGCERLGDVDAGLFMEHIDDVRAVLGDAKLLRALHFFDETERVKTQRACLEQGNFEAFLTHMRLSGASSAQYLQNVSPRGDGRGEDQPAMVILALCAHLLGEHGAWRIHGGGFGGSVLAFVPRGKKNGFVRKMNALLGDLDDCRPVGFGGPGVQWEKLA